jgi:valyl-tRNA synthetase
LSTVTENVTNGLNSYKFAEVSRELYDFAWKEFCSVYAEMLKGRVEDPAQRAVAQRMSAYVLDTLLRLLHPIMPFITEEIWSLLGQAAPQRGLEEIDDAAESLVIADWPAADPARRDAELESQFAKFQEVLGALREIRSRQNIAPKQQIEFSVRCDHAMTTLLQPMEPYFESMARATNVGWGTNVTPPATSAQVNVAGVELFVNLQDLIDVGAEKERLGKQAERLQKVIGGKARKLENENFVTRAPAEVVQQERESLIAMQAELQSILETLNGFSA